MLGRSARVAVSLMVAATAMSGLLVGPAPQHARAALTAIGVADSLTMKHDRTAVVPAPGVLGNDLNLLGGATAILVSGVSHGSLTLRSDGGYTYTPSAGYVGTDSFRYHPSGLLYTSATVTITITNATPVARPDAYSGMAGTTLVVAAPGVLANDTDADGDALVTEQVGGITGSLDLHPNGGFSYTPGGGFSGTATFNYRVWDGVVWSGTTTVTLTIVAPTPSPTPTPSQSPTPSPSPTPRPTASPTPRPSASPTPSPSLPIPSLPIPSLPLPTIPLPTPSPSLPPLPLPTPSPTPVPWPTVPLPSIGLPGSPSPSPSGDPGASSSMQPSPSQDPSGTASPAASDAGGGGGTTPGSGSGPSGPSVGSDAAPRQVSLRGPETGVGLETLGVLSGLDTWIVPAAVIAGPGLIVLLWIALQAAGALAWIPATRRLRDGDVSRGRR